MPGEASESSVDIPRLILIPAIITLAITLLRLGGELAHWSTLFFGSAKGGGLAIVGISWLPFIFGPYFAVKLARSGHGPTGLLKSIVFPLLGFIIVFIAVIVGFLPKFDYPGKEWVGYLLIALGAAVVALGWPALFRVLVAYGYAARIPLLILMYLAIRRRWPTHYAVLPSMYAGVSRSQAYLHVVVLPQMIFWVAATVLVGSLTGAVAAACMARRGTRPQAG